MVNVLEPTDPLLKRYISSIYIFCKGDKEVKYTSYPSNSTAVGLFRDAEITYSDGYFVIKKAGRSNFCAIVGNRAFAPVSLHYHEMVDEIAINFKPMGFCSFTGHKFTGSESKQFFNFSYWNSSLKNLFDNVFKPGDANEQLKIIEAFLLSQYQPAEEEELHLKAISVLEDPDSDHKIKDIAQAAGVNQKYFYRSFLRHVGCSPAHFRKIARFRNAVHSKLDKGAASKFIELCYDHNYTDQPYFIKQFRELTGENPKRFFKTVSTFGESQLIFRMHDV